MELGFEFGAFAFAKQAPYCLSNTSSPFYALIILVMGSLETICLDWPLNLDPPI
jgi:hypothetical protein